MPDYKRIASSVRKDIKNIYSFDITSNANDTRWALKVNKTKLVGLYPTREAANEVLLGLLYRNGASKEFAASFLNHLAEKGKGVGLTEDKNALSIGLEGTGGLTLTVQNFEQPTMTQTDSLFLGFQESNTQGVWSSSPGFVDVGNNAYNFSVQGYPTEGATFSYTTSSVWGSLPENILLRPVLFTIDNQLNVTLLDTKFDFILKDTVADTWSIVFTLGNSPNDNSPVALQDRLYLEASRINGLAPTKVVSYSRLWDRTIPDLSGLSIVNETTDNLVESNFSVDSTSEAVPTLNRTLSVNVDLDSYPDLDYAITYEYSRQVPTMASLSVQVENT